jgi:hypothetical protein
MVQVFLCPQTDVPALLAKGEKAFLILLCHQPFYVPQYPHWPFP